MSIGWMSMAMGWGHDRTLSLNRFGIMRTKIYVSALAIFSALPCCARAAQSSVSAETTIWFGAAATNFTESTPLGNGRLGAMMFGGIDEERIVLNESSVWSGSRQDADRPDAYKVLPEIRKLLLEGKNPEAEALVNANFICKGPGSSNGTGNGQYGCYQVLGNLHLTFPHDSQAPIENYRRELNLNEAIAWMQFTRAGVTFTQEMFVSAPNQVMLLRLSADSSKEISFEARLDRPERFETSEDGQNGLLMCGQLDNGLGGGGVRYAARVRVLNRGGEVSVKENVLRITKADEVILLIAAATDYQGFAGRPTKSPLRATLDDLNKAARKSFKSLRQAHVADYQKYFQRVSLHLEPRNAAAANKPTPQRIKAARADAGDPGLPALYFNFGRYLLISSSRPGGFPANLQGIWAEEIQTPWTGDWHLDINVEMNYWPAEVCNLSELTKPLFDLIASLQEPGAKTAQAYYHAPGWVAHVIANPWGFTSPGESADWGSTTSGSGWLCQHLWNHWLFTHDKKFLKWAYPIMKGSALFYLDMLVEDPAHHWLVVAPANSPENHFLMPDGRQAAIGLGTTFQAQLTRYLLTACIEASEILGIDADFCRELSDKRARLAPTQIGPDGRVMEWMEPYKEAEPHHRHVSHLWGLYPGDEISPETTPALAAAARKTLEARTDEGLGWSLAFKALMWARLGDGDHAWKLVRNALAPAYGMDMRYDKGGGVYPNLFDACPPFQIDGNFGVTAAIAEMLLQSEDCCIHLLPALPKAWKNGMVEGLRGRGGFEIDIEWKDGLLVVATIKSSLGGTCHVFYSGKEIILETKKGDSIRVDGMLSTHKKPS
jgi:alpha-L-fucosidase 2